jgi:N-acetylmuramoyl-L-alanine amidase
MKTKYKRKTYYTIAIIGIILIAFQFWFDNPDNQITKENTSAAKGETKESVKLLSSSEDGNISVEENEFFRKYVIRNKNEQKNINFVEEEDYIKLVFQEESELNLSLNGFNYELKDTIFRKIDSNSNELFIKKEFKNNNFVYIDQRDSKNVVVLTSKSEEPYKYKVLVDPGHGGVDVGANVGNLLEKDITLKIAKYMVDDLRYKGCVVKLSRDIDKTIRIEEVAEIANKMKADVLVSVHINFYDVSKYNGVGTYYSFNYADEELNKNERIALAKTIQKHIIKDDGWKDRNVTRDKLKVLRLSEMPSALVECGFLSNPSDREKLKREEVLMNFAKNISNGILEFLNSN